MDTTQIIGELKRYESELARILIGFDRTRENLRIDRSDDPLFLQYTREVIDLFNDALGRNAYASQIAADFNNGISNFVGLPSFNSVEHILGIVRASITRFATNVSEKLVEIKRELVVAGVLSDA